MTSKPPAAPHAASLPARRFRSARAAKRNIEFELLIEVVTPILGGGYHSRELDDVDVVRAPTVRGHLRFWWRALNGHVFATGKDLYEAESAIWGRAAGDRGGRSAVEVLIEVERTQGSDNSDIHPQRTPGAYALWPARSERRAGTPPAPRYAPGIRFRMRVVAPQDKEKEARDAIRAWLTFGGYGSRTRRGLGSLTVLENAGDWLPSAPTRQAFSELFGRDIFHTTRGNKTDVPWLAGAALHVGEPAIDATETWLTALDWLREFRQGTSGPPGNRAREPGTGKPGPRRPSISNWPEADKVRHLLKKTRSHPPRHNAIPAWPRAGFGLPIVGRFQTRGREEDQRYDEPNDFKLLWRSPNPGSADEFEEHERLASPLIVKALPLGNRRFVPCALWLNRAHPQGEVFLQGVNNSGAPFNCLVAPGDTPHFAALASKSTLREAFLDWLGSKYGTTVVAP